MGKIPPRYLLRRIGTFFLTIWVAATIIWVIPRLAPGDPVSAMVGQMSQSGNNLENSEAIIAGYEERFGLNDPLPQQYLRYLYNSARFDFGYSLEYFPTSVNDMIWRAMPWTIGLLLLAMSITFLLGNTLGAFMAWRRTPSLVKAIIPLAMTFTAIPTILAGLFLWYLFIVILEWFPPPIGGGYGLDVTPGLNAAFIQSVIEQGTLPAASIVLVTFGYWALGMRGMMITVQGEDYMHLARAKGLNPFYVLYRYAVRNAILPQVTAFAITLGTLVSGQILVEYVFQYPGMGSLMWDAIPERDYTVIQGVSFILIVMTATAVLIIDLAYPFIDPRITHGEG